MDQNLRLTNDYAAAASQQFALDAGKTALIIIDMQYASGHRYTGLGKRMIEQGTPHLVSYRFDRIEQVVVPGIQRLLGYFREHGLRVIYVTIGSQTEDYSDTLPHMRGFFQMTNNRAGTREHEILDELKPQPGEIVVNKTTIGAFTGSNLDSVLRAIGAEYLLFTGVSTNMCVDTTARVAADLGYKCVMVEDALGSAKPEYHEAALVTFQRFFGRVMSIDECLAELDRSRAAAGRG